MLKKRRPEVAVGFLLATIFWIGILGWQASYAPTEMQKQECQEAAHKSGHKAEECKSLWEKTTSDPVAFFTFVLAVSTIGLWVATILLYRAGERQIGVAERSADIAEASLVKLQRAFVFPVDFAVNWHWYLDDENRFWWSVRPIFENAGSSASADLTTNLNFAVLDNPLPPGFSFPLAEHTHNAMIGPKAKIFGGQIAIDGADLIAIRNGTKHLYFWGLLRYNDIFENTGEHVTTFCRYITNVTGEPLSRPTGDNPVGFFFAMHNVYNSSE